MSSDPGFEELVNLYYRPLYQFAYSLTRSEADAADLAQQTFFIWATKGHQLRDRSKVKSWLFTTLHREHTGAKRRETRFPQLELTQADRELPSIPAAPMSGLDAARVLKALADIDEGYRSAVALFYLQDVSYKEIADILEIPIGTVKSRLSRGIAQLQQILMPDLKLATPKEAAHE